MCFCFSGFSVVYTSCSVPGETSMLESCRFTGMQEIAWLSFQLWAATGVDNEETASRH